MKTGLWEYFREGGKIWENDIEAENWMMGRNQSYEELEEEHSRQRKQNTQRARGKSKTYLPKEQKNDCVAGVQRMKEEVENQVREREWGKYFYIFFP